MDLKQTVAVTTVADSGVGGHGDCTVGALIA
jgi:hypothetical protein